MDKKSIQVKEAIDWGHSLNEELILMRGNGKFIFHLKCLISPQTLPLAIG